MNDYRIEQPNFKTGIKRGNAPVPLSILDIAITGKGYSAMEGIGQSIELAILADRRGYSRYWVTWHHYMPTVSTLSSYTPQERYIMKGRQSKMIYGTAEIIV